jgi:hypothetical protein
MTWGLGARAGSRGARFSPDGGLGVRLCSERGANALRTPSYDSGFLALPRGQGGPADCGRVSWRVVWAFGAPAFIQNWAIFGGRRHSKP